jgi:hypothetical protein
VYVHSEVQETWSSPCLGKGIIRRKHAWLNHAWFCYAWFARLCKSPLRLLIEVSSKHTGSHVPSNIEWRSLKKQLNNMGSSYPLVWPLCLFKKNSVFIFYFDRRFTAIVHIFNENFN